jgi:hypothetical protein
LTHHNASDFFFATHRFIRVEFHSSTEFELGSTFIINAYSVVSDHTGWVFESTTFLLSRVVTFEFTAEFFFGINFRARCAIDNVVKGWKINSTWKIDIKSATILFLRIELF